jgi:putative peptide zinc metalloprotease protein
MNAAELLDNPAERRKEVRLKVRPDLHISAQKYEGKTFHVVKDPVCLRYYRFNQQEYFVFSLFDGTHSMEAVRKRFEDEFRPHRLEFQDLESFARQLVTAGLVQHETGGAGKHLFARRAKQRRMRRLAAVSNILYWKIPVFDPDRILTWMYRHLWWIFTWPFFAASVGLMLAAVFHVLVHFDTFYAKMPEYQEFFAFRTAFYMWLSLGVVKVIHEFGHGLSCKAFKGECHEMGVLLMCLSPALYCNVTDAWTVADKWKRIVISFAGIYVELVIAALATFVWWYTPSMPIVNYTAMCVMVLCSVSTVVFNANPLMRFDGYYMMADWLEIPNLRDRANRYLTNTFLETGFGIEAPPEPYMAPGRKVLFVVYAVASYVYRWVVTFSIIWFLADFLGPQLKILSRMLAVASLASMFIWPVYRMIKGVRQRGRLPDMKPKRAYATLAVFAGLVAAFFLVPLPVSKVRETGLVKEHAEHTEAVGLSAPGHLVSLHVRDGQAVRKGDLLARFDSRELREQLAEAAAKRDEQRAARDAARDAEVAGGPLYREQNRVEAATAQQKMNEHAEQVTILTRQLKDLGDLYAPRDGVVMGLPKRSEAGKLFGQYSAQEKPVCHVGDPARLVVQLPVNSTEYVLLTEDLAANKGKPLDADVYVAGRTDRLFKGVVRRVPDADAKQVPIALTQRANGPLAVKSAGEQGQEITPVAKTYLVEVELLDPDPSLVSGAQVAVKVHCRWRTAAWWVGRKLAEALDIGLY